jgi:hypothetical protein
MDEIKTFFPFEQLDLIHLRPSVTSLLNKGKREEGDELTFDKDFIKMDRKVN